MHPVGCNMAELWLEAMDFERTLSLIEKSSADKVAEKCRDLLGRAFGGENAVNDIDWPESLLDSWMKLETQFGSASSILETTRRINELRHQVEKRRARENRTVKTEKQAKDDGKKQHHSEKPRESKREGQKQHDKPKRPREEQSQNADAGKQSSKRKRDLEGDAAIKKYKVAHDKTEPVDAEMTDAHATGTGGSEERTVFVGNLDPSVEEENLREVFKPCGDIESIRVVKNYGKAAAYAYVNFKVPQAAQRALDLDHTPLITQSGKKRMNVKPFRSNKIARVVFKNVLFVTNLPENITEEALQEMFGECGEVTQLRLYSGPKHVKPGKTPYGYVEFKDETGAEVALELNGMEIEGVPMFCRLSDRPFPVPKPKYCYHYYLY